MKKDLTRRAAAGAMILVLAAGGASWGQYTGGSGTEADPCQISTVDDWQTLIDRPGDWGKHFKLMNDIDFGGMALTPVAPDVSYNYGFQGTSFTGVFDGDGHVVRNAVINQPGKDYVGIFGYLDSGGQIRNLGVEDPNIAGLDYVGRLVGYNFITITSCYAKGDVRGNIVGGLVGYNNDGKVIRSYSTGKPTGNSRVGGLCGGTNTGGSYEDRGNFWDTETSETTISAMGVGKTTGEMKTRSTFTAEDWDFMNIWRMCVDGVDYPGLKWEFSKKGDLVCPDGVDLLDLAYWCGHWLEDKCSSAKNYCGRCDFDRSGRVELFDYRLLGANWLKK